MDVDLTMLHYQLALKKKAKKEKLLSNIGLELHKQSSTLYTCKYKNKSLHSHVIM